MPLRGQSPKYEPLRRYLAARPATESTLALTFAEIEALLGAPLPASAVASGWWTSRRGSPQERAWRAAGWRVVGMRPSLPSVVTFERLPPR